MILVKHIVEMKRVTKGGYNPKFNCWGATQYALGERKRYGWVGSTVMTKWLNQKTTTVNSEESLELGDILVITNSASEELIHTATYCGKGRWFQKVGKFQATFNSQNEVIKQYSTDIYVRNLKDLQVTIRRLNKKK
jgi:hypothetical protein